MPRLVCSSLVWAGCSYSYYATALRVCAVAAASSGIGSSSALKVAGRNVRVAGTHLAVGRSRTVCMAGGYSDAPPSKVLAHDVGVSVRLPGGITSVDHVFRLPLSWGFDKGDEEATQGGDKRCVDVFARELVLTKHIDVKDRPYLLFLQGGPGFPAPRVGEASGWWGRALEDFRVVMLDQRGTGRSSPISHRSLAEMDSPEAQANFLGNFRADSIVEDCEAIRRELVGEDTKWTVLGQSFGGFCLLTYLSKHPASVKAGLFTGGLAPVLRTPDEVYRATYRRVAERNRRFYKRYPGDVEKVKKILRHLRKKEVQLPAGGVLTPGRFLQLGLALGSGGGFEALHYLFEEPFDGDGELKYSFLREVESRQAYDTNPIYAILHESIYLRGEGVDGPSAWSAERVLAEDAEVRMAFDWEEALEEGNDRPAYMAAEMVYRWMFDGPYACLRGLKEAAGLLAGRNGWPPLYDRSTLEKCEVPCAAIVYYDDIYVERDFSEETSKILPDCKIWVTNRYQHSGLREDGKTVLDTLLGMARGEIELPS